MTVGKLSQATEQVTENILCCIEKLASSLPGGWKNIRSAHVKVQDSPAVPIYVSFGMTRFLLPELKFIHTRRGAMWCGTMQCIW